MNQIIKGYSLYVNNAFYEVYGALEDANKMAIRYGRFNATEILPMWGTANTKGTNYGTC